MSTIDALNLRDGTISVRMSVATKGAPKAWVRFLEGSVIDEEYNVDSVTDVSTGVHSYSYSSVFAVEPSVAGGIIGATSRVMSFSGVSNESATQVIITRSDTAAAEDRSGSYSAQGPLA